MSLAEISAVSGDIFHRGKKEHGSPNYREGKTPDDTFVTEGKNESQILRFQNGEK